MKEDVEIYKQQGLNYISLLHEANIIDILKYVDSAYYNYEEENHMPLLDDLEYDILREYAKNKYGNHSYFKNIGSPIKYSNDKVSLPIFMGSMNKIKPDTTDVSNWLNKYKGEYIISAKLDGVSGLYVKEKGIEKLYTRGDGFVGKDISHLIPYLNLPKSMNEDIMIRGEFIISKKVFREKYENDFSNIRNLVAGIINTRIINNKVKDIDFVIYELIQPILKPKEQLKYVTNHNFKVVDYIEKETMTEDFLKERILFLKKNYLYEIDGIIIMNNDIYERKIGNPDYAFAYKIILNDQIKEAVVKDVIWTASKDGYLKPRIEIEPLLVGNIMIHYLNGFNGSYIKNNKINVGSRLNIIRSGDVIPHILEVKSFSEKGKMPDIEYTWNSSMIDIMLKDLDNDMVKTKRIVLFLKTIGVSDISEGLVKKLIEKGYDTIETIVQSKIEDFLKINGFQERMANKIYNGIKNSLENVGLVEFMVASNIFGRGTSINKIKLILDNYPDVLDKDIIDVEKINKITQIKGMSLKSATEFVERIPYFFDFCEKILDKDKLNKLFSIKKENIVINHELYKKPIVITGFRNKILKEWIENVGGIIGNNVNNKTYIVISSSINNKTNEAKKLNIPIYSLDEFINKYKIEMLKI